MLDEIPEELVQQAAKTLPKALGGLISVGKKLVNNRDLFNHTKEYKTRLEADCSHMQILGMEQPISLDHVYTEVRIVNRVKARMYKTIGELHEDARKSVERRMKKKIVDEITKRLEYSIRKERVQSATAEINSEYHEGLEQIQTERRKVFEEIFPDAQESMELGLKRLQKDYHQRLSIMREDIDSKKWHEQECKQEKQKLKKRYTDKVRDEYHSALAKLETKQEQKTLHLAELVENATTSFSEIEDSYRNLFQDYENKLKGLKADKSSKLRALKREFMSSPLTDNEQNQLAKQLSEEVEKDLKEKTHRELTQRVFEDFGHATQSAEQPQPAWGAVAEKNYVLILGQPGAGKTTFLRYIVLKHLRSSISKPKVPILIALRAFSRSGSTDLLEFTAQQFADCGFPDAPSFVKRLIESKHECVILFDGLDEVSHTEQQEIVEQIVRLSKRYRKNQYFVSCRTANYRGQLSGFTEFEIVEFGREQVATFVSGWFHDNENMADDFLSEIKQHHGLSELTHTPLLLALLCIGFRRNQSFPAQKALVYKASLEALLVDWDSIRQVKRDVLVKDFDFDTKKQLIAKVACDTFCDGNLFFSYDEIVDLLNEDSTFLPVPQNQGKKILQEYIEYHGLIVERAKGIFSFSHLTFQEFLTALHLSINQPNYVIENLVAEAWEDDRWKETVVFLGGLLQRADMFAVCIRNHIKKKISDCKLMHLFIPRELPEAAKTYIDRPKTVGDKTSWTAWFRWRLFEYRLHEASYGTDASGIATQLGMMNISSLIARALGFGEELKRPLSFHRPLNYAISESFIKLDTPDMSEIFIAETPITLKYLSLVSTLCEILSSGIKIEPTLRLRVLLDIAQPTVDMWDYPVLTRENRLGA